MKDKHIYKGAFRYTVIILIIAFIVAIDQWTKSLVVSRMQLYEEKTIIPGFFRLNYVRNRGAGLGILSNARWVFLTATVIVIVIIAILLLSDYFKNLFADISLCLILAGGIGNMIDRIVLKEVVDFFQFQIRLFDFVFNVADVFVTFGTVMFLVYYLLRGEKKDANERPTSEN